MSLSIFSARQVQRGLAMLEKSILNQYTLLIDRKEYQDPKNALIELAEVGFADRFQIELTDGLDVLISIEKTESVKEPIYTIHKFDCDTTGAIQTIHNVLSLKI